MLNWLEKHRLPPPVIMLIVAALMGLASWHAPAIPVDLVWRAGVAAIIAAAGIAIAVAGVREFAKARTTVNPLNIKLASSLVTNGVFAWTRNPMYLGMTLLLLAWMVFLASPLLVAGPAMFMLFIQRFQIRPEEKVMENKFGKAFEDYRANVRRWI